MSSYAYLQGQENLELIPGFCIGAKERVKSVKLYHKGLLNGVTIGVTPHSASSVQLLHVLAKHHWKVETHHETFEFNDLPSILRGERYEAFLLIGDPCLRHEEVTGFKSIDLATAWYEMTGLPFTFAVFAGRNGHLPEGLPRHLDRSLHFAEENPSKHLQSAQEVLPHMDTTELANYFKGLHYRFDDKMEEGLSLFATLAMQ